MKKAYWKGYAVKCKGTGKFIHIYQSAPEINLLKALLEQDVTINEVVVPVELIEIEEE